MYMCKICTCFNERRKEDRSKQGQTNNKAKQHSIPRQSLFLRKMSYLRWDSNRRHSTLQTESSTTELPRQLSWLGPNLTCTCTCISKIELGGSEKKVHHQISLLWSVHRVLTSNTVSIQHMRIDSRPCLKAPSHQSSPGREQKQ